jgi:hypothetical protein
LQQVQREHQDLLVFQLIAGELPALAVKEEAVSTIPVLDDIQPLVNLPT